MERAISQILLYTLIKIHPKWHVVDPNSLHSKLLINRNLNKKKHVSQKNFDTKTMTQCYIFTSNVFCQAWINFSPSLNCKIYYYYLFFKNSRCGHFVIRLLTNGNYLLPFVKTWSQIFATFAMLIVFQFCNLFWIWQNWALFSLWVACHIKRLVTDICPLLSYGVDFVKNLQKKKKKKRGALMLK